jgi:hypothetical protein
MRSRFVSNRLSLEENGREGTLQFELYGTPQNAVGAHNMRDACGL